MSVKEFEKFDKWKKCKLNKLEIKQHFQKMELRYMVMNLFHYFISPFIILICYMFVEIIPYPMLRVLIIFPIWFGVGTLLSMHSYKYLGYALKEEELDELLNIGDEEE